jgi:hypothetical protein
MQVVLRLQVLSQWRTKQEFGMPHGVEMLSFTVVQSVIGIAHRICEGSEAAFANASRLDAIAMEKRGGTGWKIP